MSPRRAPDDAFGIEVRTVLHGRFFEGSPGDRLHRNLVGMVEDLARATAAEIARDAPHVSGRFGGSVYGELKRGPSVGRLFKQATEIRGFGRSRLSDNQATSYASWLEKGVRRGRAGGLVHGKAHGMFARGRRKLKAFRPEIAEILRDVAE
jgi:hypothetical protein